MPKVDQLPQELAELPSRNACHSRPRGGRTNSTSCESLRTGRLQDALRRPPETSTGVPACLADKLVRARMSKLVRGRVTLFPVAPDTSRVRAIR
jgi:hypothetical protein